VNTEALIYKALRRKLPQVDWQRVENWVGSGVPDCNGAFLWPPEGQQTGLEIWCELKVCRTKRYKPAGLWRPAQIAYQTRRSAKIANVWNLVSHPEAEVIYIYSGDKTHILSSDSTDTSDLPPPDLTLPFDGPWDAALGLFASRQVR
jgi:hypothetical protein